MKYLKSVLMLLMTIFLLSGLVISSPLYAEPPSNSGPRVFRVEGWNWFLIDANGMVAFVGPDVSAVCEGGLPYASLQYQNIDNPADADLIMSLAKVDDAPTYVYPEAALEYLDNGWPDIAHLCGYHYLYGPIASGTSDGIFTDNDGKAADNFHSRVNSWGLSATGVLFTPSDDPVSFSAGFRCRFNYDQDPDKAWEKCRNRLNLGK